MENRDELIKKILEDEDYIKAPKYGNSVAKFVAKNPDGADNKLIARVLLMTEDEVDKIVEEAVEMIRADMVEDED